MKIQAFIGRAGMGKTYAMYKKIESILQEDAGASILFIVPDPATYHVERELALFQRGKGFTSVRVVGFGRLLHQVKQQVGLQEKKTISEVGKSLLLRSILKAHEKELTIFRTAARKPNFANLLKTFIVECHAFQITPDELQSSTSQLESIVLQQKMQDLSLLTAAYEEVITQRYGAEAEDSMEQLLRLLPLAPLAQNAYVFIDGFHWFTPIQKKVLETLMNLSRETTISMTLPTQKMEMYRRSGALFFRPLETKEWLDTAYPTDMEYVFFGEQKRWQNQALATLESDFFTVPTILRGEVTPLPKLEIPLWQGYNREREVDAIGREILKLVEEKGRRFKDIAIILRDSETYGDLLEKALWRYEIPFFSDRRNPMACHPVSELLEGLLALVPRKLHSDVLFRVLKTDLFPLPRHAVDELENYCLAYGVNEKDWFSEEKWDFGQEANERVERIHGYRQVVQSLLLPFYTFAKKQQSGSAWAEKIFHVLEVWDIPHTLQVWYEAAEEKGDLAEAAAHAQMYKQVISLLEEVYTLVGEEVVSVEEVAVLLKEGIAEMTYSLVPPSLDHVTITTIDRGYTSSFPIVFIPGLNEGIFPQRMGQEGIIRDAERDMLRQAGISLAAGALGQAFNENFLFYLATTRASEQLYLSYALNDDAGAPLEPSLPVRRLEQAGYVGKALLQPLTIPYGKETDYLWRWKQSLHLFSSVLSPLMEGKELAPTWWQFYDWALGEPKREDVRLATLGVTYQNKQPLIQETLVEKLLVKDHMMVGSVTRLERYHACPFQFYAQYVLRTMPRKIRSFGAPEVGTYLHTCLYEMGKFLLSGNRQWRDLDGEEKEQLCKETAEKVASEDHHRQFMSDAYYQDIRRRLEATLQFTVDRLILWSARSKFNTMYLEQSFGDTSCGWELLPFHCTESVYIRGVGQIDRLDIYRDDLQQAYAMIVDYKSGNVGISAMDIYYGLKMQLITYLMAVERHYQGAVKPAGLIYTFVKTPDVRERVALSEVEAKAIASEKEIKNTGYFMNNSQILAAIDETIGQEATPFVPVRMTAKGIHQADKSKLKSEAEFSAITHYVETMVESTGKSILKGEFPISPYKKSTITPCRYCEYRSLCQFDPKQRTNRYRLLDTLKEEEAMKKIESQDVYTMERRS